MGIDQLTKLIDTIASLLQVLIWPFIVVFLWRTLKIYIEDLRKDKTVNEMGIDVGLTGFKFNFKKQVEVAAMLIQAETAKQMESSQGSYNGVSSAQTDAIADTVSQTANPIAAQRIAGAKLLWVDDHPENNVYPRRAMEAIGIQITLSKSTEAALENILFNTYDVIISDMGRQPLDPQAPYDKRAGYTLLDKLREQRIFTPFIIYAGSKSLENQSETKRRGGFGTTNNPQELFQMVIDAIQQK